MSARQQFGWVLPFLVWSAWAESPQEAARRLMEASVARQAQAVAVMRVSIEKQRTALAAVTPDQPPRAASVATGSPAFFTLSWPAFSGDCAPLSDAELSPLIQQAAQRAGLDANLLRAVARQESAFRSCAVSEKGAMGLMQLMPSTVQELGVHDPFDPAESLLSGARLLKQLLDHFGGDTALALSAYNAGPARVEASGGVPAIPETTRYVTQILSQLPIP